MSSCMSTERSRREFLARSWNGIGSLALSGMLAEAGAADSAGWKPFAPRAPHFPRKAKRCIFLFMAGGASQLDTFDYKPALRRFAGQRLPRTPGLSGEIDGFLSDPHRTIPSPFQFRQYGQSGRWMTSLLPKLAAHADDLAFIHGIKVDNNNHGPATMHVNTGSQFPGSPSVGSWISYGLGTPNQNLPGYVVLQDPRGAPVNGAAVWSAGYLPAAFQGTLFRSKGVPVIDLAPPKGVSREQQRQEFDLLHAINSEHLRNRREEAELEARISAYELAFRMQTEAPGVVDLSGESEATRRLYGLDNPVTEGFGRQCLLARRLVENGVRHVLCIHGVEIGRYSWDDHGNIGERMPAHLAEVDTPVAGLLSDLKSRGLLEETLVVWTSEMGRTPFINDLASEKPGRDHNQWGLTVWMAGGDVKGGATAGETDEFGIKARGEPIPIRDVHATILNLLGLSDDRLTYLHAGRYRKLTDIGGRVLRGVV
ncbi:MAG: DUF1501 domain-containing protein [Acidobacteria bacterium]|nr:DUF1501 domain-containing protein [Acidobacteriota bacterium]